MAQNTATERTERGVRGRNTDEVGSGVGFHSLSTVCGSGC